MDNLLEIIKSVEPDNEDELVSALEDAGIEGDALEAAKAIQRLVKAFDEIDPVVLAKAIGVDPPEEANESTESEDKPLSKSDLEQVPAHLRKSVEAVLEKNEDLSERVDGLASAIAKQEDARRLEFYKSEVSDLTNLNIKTDELAETVKSVADADKEAAERMIEVLRAANEQAQEGSGDLYKSVGSPNRGSHTPTSVEEAGEELEKRARELVNKSDNDMTLAQAQEKILRDDPELQRAYFSN